MEPVRSNFSRRRSVSSLRDQSFSCTAGIVRLTATSERSKQRFGQFWRSTACPWRFRRIEGSTTSRPLRQITAAFAPETHFIEVGLVPQEQRKHKSIALTVVGRRLVAQPRALADQNDEEFSYN